jgi:hypothetical protein
VKAEGRERLEEVNLKVGMMGREDIGSYNLIFDTYGLKDWKESGGL